MSFSVFSAILGKRPLGAEIRKKDIGHRGDDVEVLRIGEDVEEDQNQGSMGPKADMGDEHQGFDAQSRDR